jgi:hypothetical protein
MNKSSLHLKLVKLYLMYFESGSRFEDTKQRKSYLRTVRYLREIEKIARQRRLEVKEAYTQTDHYKNVVKKLTDKDIERLRSNYESRSKRKN